MTLEEPEWAVIMFYESLPGGQRPRDALFA